MKYLTLLLASQSAYYTPELNNLIWRHTYIFIDCTHTHICNFLLPLCILMQNIMHMKTCFKIYKEAHNIIYT